MSEQPKARRARGSGRYFLRGRIVWIQWSERGKQRREPTTLSVDTPNWEKKAERQLRIKTGLTAAGISQDDRGLRYEDLRDSYLKRCELHEKKSLHRDKNGKVYMESVRRLDGFFEGYRAIDIDTELVQKFQLDQQKKGLSNGSINRAVAALRRMFTLKMQSGDLRNIPYFPMLPESKARKGTLPQKKYAELLAVLPEYVRPVVTIGFRTGMRLGEILGLQWSNVLWMERIIRIEDSKNNEAREVPFTADLESVLHEQYGKRQEGCDRVCFRVNRLGNAGPIGNFRKPWRRACVRIGVGRMEPVLDDAGKPAAEKPRYLRSKSKPKLKYVGLIFHDLRRTFITDAENSGAPRHEVMKISGHKTESVYKRYAIENREQRRAALGKIEAYRSEKLRDNSGTIEAISGYDTSVTQ